MWLLASRNRPHLAAECIAACTDMGMLSPAILYVDAETADGYERIPLPGNWTLHVAGEHAGLSAALQWGLTAFPSEPSYGWLADDMRPLSPQFDRLLEHAAGTRFMAQAMDNWAAVRDPVSVRRGIEPSAGQCWGGDLVRAVGWWALPGTFQAGTDVAWCRMLSELGRVRYLPHVVVEHRHWRTGKRERDALDTDMWDSNEHEHTERDLEILFSWLKSVEYRRTVGLIRRRCPVRGPISPAVYRGRRTR
jgi:hypothetical protein